MDARFRGGILWKAPGLLTRKPKTKKHARDCQLGGSTGRVRSGRAKPRVKVMTEGVVAEVVALAVTWPC